MGGVGWVPTWPPLTALIFFPCLDAFFNCEKIQAAFSVEVSWLCALVVIIKYEKKNKILQD